MTAAAGAAELGSAAAVEAQIHGEGEREREREKREKREEVKGFMVLPLNRHGVVRGRRTVAAWRGGSAAEPRVRS